MALGELMKPTPPCHFIRSTCIIVTFIIATSNMDITNVNLTPGCKIPQSDLRGGGASLSNQGKKTCRRRQPCLKIVTLSIRTMIDDEDSNLFQRRTAIIDRELSRFNIDIAALNETQLSEEGSLQEVNYTFFWKGRIGRQPRTHGMNK